MRNVEFGILAERGIVSRLQEFNPVRGSERIFRLRSQVHDAQIGKTAVALEQDEMVLESFRGSEHDFRPIRNNLSPEFPAGLMDRGDHDAKRAPAGVCPHEENPSAGAR